MKPKALQTLHTGALAHCLMPLLFLSPSCCDLIFVSHYVSSSYASHSAGQYCWSRHCYLIPVNHLASY